MKKPKMYRQRYIPYEIVDISSDELLYRDDNLLVTRWEPINPRIDFHKGISYVFLDRGVKISKLFNENDEFLKYYCDIIEVEYRPQNDEYIFKDLLVDVTIKPDGRIRVLDLDELAEAFKKELITKEQLTDSLKKTDEFLKMIYKNEFPPSELLKEY